MDLQITSHPTLGDWIVFAAVALVMIAVGAHVMTRLIYSSVPARVYIALTVAGVVAVVPWFALGLLS